MEMNRRGEAMTTVYILRHLHTYDLLPGGSDIKFIGVYSSQENAEKILKELIKQPGFCDYPEGFYIETYKIDDDHYMKKKPTLTTQD